MNKKNPKIDSVFLTLVPRIVDTNLEIFKDKRSYLKYSKGEIRRFLGNLPFSNGNPKEIFNENKSYQVIFPRSRYCLNIGFNPDYGILNTKKNTKKTVFDSKDITLCPSFNVFFKHVYNDGTKQIIEVALSRFFLRQGDLDAETLMAVGVKKRKVSLSGLELLTEFLSKGFNVEARCDYSYGNGKANYRI